MALAAGASAMRASAVSPIVAARRHRIEPAPPDLGVSGRARSTRLQREACASPTIRNRAQTHASARLRNHSAGSAGSLGLEVDGVDQQAAIAGEVAADDLEGQAGARGAGEVLDGQLLPAVAVHGVAGLV